MGWKTRTGSRLPFSVAGGSSSYSKRRSVASYVAWPTATPISGATDWMRDAVLTASPARKRSPAPGVTIEADKRLAGVDADAQPQRSAAEGGQARGPVADPEGGSDGPFGIVFVRLRDAEHADDGVADELLDDAAVRLDLATRDREVAGQHPVDVLGIRRLGRRGEADEIAEQRGDDLALLRERHTVG